MIQQLREYPTPDELRELYPAAHDSGLYGRGHGIRVALTIATARAWQPEGWAAVVDLSCGDGRIAHGVSSAFPLKGDLAPGPGIEPDWIGPLEEQLQHRLVDGWDLYVCSETLEHLKDPLLALTLIRSKAKQLLLSTPIMGYAGDTNPEHVWCWDRAGVESLLSDAGWRSQLFVELDTRPFGDPYTYGIWIAS